MKAKNVSCPSLDVTDRKSVPMGQVSSLMPQIVEAASLQNFKFNFNGGHPYYCNLRQKSKIVSLRHKKSNV